MIPPSRPADQEDRGGVSRISRDLPRCRGVPRFHSQELDDRGVTRQVEELLVHRVEEPAQRGDGEDEPLVPRDVPPPGGTTEIGGGSAGGTVVENHAMEISEMRELGMTHDQTMP